VTGKLRILYVAYPLLTVSEASAGGAEQILWTLEREMAMHGVITSVAASAGSRVSGELIPTGDACIGVDDFERRKSEHQGRIIGVIGQLAREGKPFDLVHDMSGGFWPRAGEIEIPLLATLHLPRSVYAPQMFENLPANVSFNCVSQSQARSFADLTGLEGVVCNGIPLERFANGGNTALRRGLLWLGRICEEKAPHLAIEIASRAGWPITIAGQVYPFSYHHQYFDREVAPRLGQPSVAFVDSPSVETKRRLLRKAQGVLITSQVDETSSLVAMEAAAAGTPVIAFRRGALPEVVKEGVTGFVVDGTEAAIAMLGRIAEIDSNTVAAYAAQNFSAASMAEGYTELYRRLLYKTKPSLAGRRDDKSLMPAV
jgi:glycosyltransferase involved in cell wall biosynthesis